MSELPSHVCSEGMPDDDRCVLIYSESYFGKDRWHPACWLGEDEEPAGKFCWAIDGAGYTREEIGATHWMEMPKRP